ncbi:SAM-dependent methyltransferase [Saccharicrinis sp. FJH54]|uniref:SAM-dependent methyltransferase n=1 Tax=Saccharicrinis sp. FJH54 TaxID=3344665 RepID=UPI0035D48EC8
MASHLYLLPTLMGETVPEDVLPAKNIALIKTLKHFIVEDLRTARRFLKTVDKSIDIDELTFYLLNEHTTPEDASKLLKPLLNGTDVGLMSDAGCPGVADPGADVVALAHEKNIRVIPLVGPSSILMAVMAAGMNGQNFSFVGYLPVRPNDKQNRLKELERRIMQENQSQVFIEAPYRNIKLAEDLLKMCSPNLRLCIAVDISAPEEYIQTKRISEWRKRLPEMHKKPAIFVLGK